MKRILYVVPVNPFKSDNGCSQRTNLILQILLKHFEVDVFCFTKDNYPQHIPAGCSIRFWEDLLPLSYGRRLLNLLRPGLNAVYYAPSAYDRMVEILGEHSYEFIFFRYLSSAGYSGLKPAKSMIVDVDDLPEQRLRDLLYETTSVLRKCFLFYTLWKVKRATRSFLKDVRHSFFPNPRQCIFPRSSFLPNIPYPVSRDLPDIPFYFRQDIVLFVGVLDYTPNISGVEYFIREIWPGIRKENPKARFRVVGKNLPEVYRQKWTACEGVEIAGFVEDIKAEYLNCKVTVAPLYAGAGTNIKVLEGMYMKRPGVISSFAARGFEEDLKDGYNVYIASRATDFSRKVLKLLDSEELNQEMSQNASATICEKYSFSVFESYLMQGLKD